MADDPWVGTILAERYRIESPYYRTTKAELYRGLDLGTETQIVVHLANGEFSQNSQFISQFEQEARRLRILEHPAIIPILEYGRERDRLFMVCPFLPGGSLEQEIRRQWSIERTNEVVERIGEALAYLHGQELVHLNVSADSIIFDEESRPHLSLGFGRICRAIDPAAGRGSVYVLPEQSRLSYVLADPKVDGYAFGVVLWLMLLGQPPYLDAPLDKQLIESGQQVELPDAWRAVLERAISSDPERRFNSMPEFLTAWRESQHVLINHATLRQTLIRSFSSEDFKDLCVQLNVDFDNLPGNSISSKKRELILHLERHRRLPDLISFIKQLRPQENLNTPLPRISQSQTDTSLEITSEALKNSFSLSQADTSLEIISEALKNSFSLEEIKDMIFDLNLNYEEYRSSKSALIGDFLAHIEQLDRKDEVVQKIVEANPKALPIAPHSARAKPTTSPQTKSRADSQTQQRYLESQDAAGQIPTTEIATKAPRPQTQTAQNASDYDAKVAQSDAAADVPSYENTEQSSRPQTPIMSKVPTQTPASNTPSGIPFPDVQVTFNLISTLPEPVWPGQTIVLNLEIHNTGSVTLEPSNSDTTWAVVVSLLDSGVNNDILQNLPVTQRVEVGQTILLNSRLTIPSSLPQFPLTFSASHILEAKLHLTDLKTNEHFYTGTTQLTSLIVANLHLLDLPTLTNPPQSLTIAGECTRLDAIAEKLQEEVVTPAQRGKVVQESLLTIFLSKSGSKQVQKAAATALQQLASLPTTHGRVEQVVSAYLQENAAAKTIVQSLLASRNTSQKLKNWLQERLQASEKLSVTSDQSPVSSLQPTEPPAANGQRLTASRQPPAAAPLRPFMLALEQIAHSKPLTHKIVFDITPQRVKLTYGGENYESPTQLDDTVLRTLALKRREYGMTLFNAILHETDRQNQRLTATRNGYDFALREAREGLYLELQLDDTLHELCWENLCDPDGLPVGISDKRALYRRVRANVSKTRIDYGKLRILVMICNPANLGPGSDNTLLQNLTPINVAGERALLEGALMRLREAGLAEYIIYDGSPDREATLENLRDELEKRDEEAYHILHLVAHGLFDKQKQYRLVMQGTGGKPEALVTATDFQEVLARGELRLAILSACLSATATEDDTDEQDAAASPDSVLVLPGLAQQLVREADIPAVIAMQGLLKADTAALFHRHFYDDLARHGRVARALAVTRGAIYDAEKKLPKSGWGVPTLFMGTDDDWLFGLDKRKVKQFDPLAPIPAEAKEFLRQGDWEGLRQHIQQNMAQGLPAFAAAHPAPRSPAPPLAPAQNRAFLQTTLQPQVRLNPFLLEAEVKKQTGLDINPMVYQQVASALNSGKHILLTGPPGTGKTSLAQAICAYAQSQQFTDDPILTTATADWTTFDTIGGYVPDTQGQLQFRPGIFLRAVRDASWLVIDEMNRAEIDKAFGELFTVLSGQAIELPYSANGQPVRVLPSAKGAEWIPPLDEAFHNVVIFPAWRIIGTMNVYDKSFLFNMSFAFMRRFAFVDVDLPPPDTYQALISRWLVPTELVDESAAAPFVALGWLLHDLVNEETVLMRRRALGPAILKDMIAYVRDRYSYEADAAALLDIFGEAFIMYALPQLDGLDHDSILDIYAYLHRLTSQLSAPMQQTLLKRLKILYPHIRTAEWDNALSNRPK